MSSFALSSFSCYKTIYSKFCYLIYLEQVKAAGNSAYSGGTESVRTGYADLNGDSWPQTVIAKFCWLVIFIATQYITEDHVRKDSLGHSACPLHSRLLPTSFSLIPCYLTWVASPAVLQLFQLLPDLFFSAQLQWQSLQPPGTVTTGKGSTCPLPYLRAYKPRLETEGPMKMRQTSATVLSSLISSHPERRCTVPCVLRLLPTHKLFDILTNWAEKLPFPVNLHISPSITFRS